jgi:hypothetical protein
MLPFLAALGIGGAADFLGQYLGHRLNQGMDQKNLARLMALYSPQSITGDANQFFSAFQRSPMYTAMRERAMQGSNILGNQLQTGYARAGLSNSGMSRTAVPIARSSVLGGFNNIDMTLFQEALQQALGSRAGMTNAMNRYPQTSPFAQAFGGMMSDIGPLLAHYQMGK